MECFCFQYTVVKLFFPAAPSENSAPPPDVTAVAPPVRGHRVDLPSKTVARGMNQGANRSSMMETADGKDLDVLTSVSLRSALVLIRVFH